MERFVPLNGEPLRMKGAALPARSLLRLEAAAAKSSSLQTAEAGMRDLTRSRLLALVAPATGDEALEAVLGLVGAAGEAAPEAELVRRVRGRAVAGGSAAHTRAEPPSVEAPPAPEVIAGTDGARAGRRLAAILRRVTRQSALTSSSPDRPRRRRRRRVAECAPSPPRGFEPAGSAQGLEWLAPRLEAAREAAETPLVEGMPDVQWGPSAPSPGPRAGGDARRAPWEPPLRPSEEPRPASGPAESRPGERAGTPRAPEPGLAGASEATTGGLSALVRAWNDETAGPLVAGAPESKPAQSPVAVEAERGNSAARRRLVEAAAREEELVAFADSLGRVLVGELERHGIEVDA